jgi:hypothetical protein
VFLVRERQAHDVCRQVQESDPVKGIADKEGGDQQSGRMLANTKRDGTERIRTFVVLEKQNLSQDLWHSNHGRRDGSMSLLVSDQQSHRGGRDGILKTKRN